MATRTITLTGRPPVRIDEENWPLIASAKDKEHDGQVECQANRMSKWFVGVRQHKDGRAIVYATYSHDSNWQGSRCYNAARCVLLGIGTDAGEICRTISAVCDDIATAEHSGDDADRWSTLANECIADMPADVLE